MKDRRRIDQLSIEELEHVLAIRKREARQAKMRKYRSQGRALATIDEAQLPEEPAPRHQQRRSIRKRLFNGSLLLFEIAVVAALLYIGYIAYSLLREINTEAQIAFASESLPTPVPTAVISSIVLPSGHTPPDINGFSQPNEAEIPEHLRPLVQSIPAIEIPEPGPEQAARLVIPKLNIDAPIVQGDGWEQLKLGVGQHLGTTNPGQAGNIVLAAHNDIFGELFRYLDQLRPDDTFTIHTATSRFTYRIRGYDIVEPTDVQVMNPTINPTATLISCYPYLVDTQRIVVFAELVEG